VKLPAVHSPSSIEGNSSKATVQAKEPIRQQPQGLKMRFRPIGFGDGETGQIGSSPSAGDRSTASDEDVEPAAVHFRRPVSVTSDSSDAEESSKNSNSEEESSSSDVEMAEAPSLLTGSTSTESMGGKSAPISSLQTTTNGSLKRKQDVREEGKSKHSLSQSSSIDERELKRLKKNQTESQRGLGERTSLSTEPQKSSIQWPSSKAETTSSKKNTASHLSETAILPQLSSAPRSQVIPGKNDARSSEKHKSKKRNRSEPAYPARKSGLSLEDLTKATDPSLTGEERRKKIKRLKHRE
jgi:hypothetical protein